MKQIEDILKIFMDYMRANLPAKLSTVPLDNFDEYLEDPPVNKKLKALAAYMGKGNHNTDFAEESFLLQAQLPKVSSPKLYNTAIEALIKDFDTALINADSLRWERDTFYPGEVLDGGGSSFILYEITPEQDLDDCMIDDDI